jgi:hypothetical protein
MEEESPRTELGADVEMPCPAPDLPESETGMSDYFVGQMTIEFAFVAPDRSLLVFSDRGEECFSCITMGDRQWCRAGDSTDWTEGPASDEDFPSRPEDFCTSIEDLPLSSAEGGRETVNGIKTIHYVLTEDASTGELQTEEWPANEGLAEELGWQSNQEVWLAEDGNWPVRQLYEYAFKAGADDFRASAFWEIRDLNDPSIVIEQPNIR